MRAAFTGLAGAGYLIRIAGTFHSNFTDPPRWSPLLPWLGVTGPTDGEWAHRIINAYTLAFFDRHLQGCPAAAPTAPFPESRWSADDEKARAGRVELLHGHEPTRTT